MRTTNAFRNFITGFAGQLVSMLLAFASRTVFIYVLGEEYLGINSLFASILSVLSFSELGIGTAITFALYKPIADGDNNKVRSLMLFYKRAYLLVGTAIFAIGLALMPFLPYLMKGTTDLVNVRIIYLLFLLDDVASYWFFAYKQSLLYSLQQNYVNTIFTTAMSFLSKALQIVLLLCLRGVPTICFYVYTVTGILLGILSNYVINVRVNRMYPELNEKGAVPLTKEEKTPIFKNIVGLSISQISDIALNASDNILISAFIGVGTVGIYGNYLTLRSYVGKLLDTLFGSIAAGVGDLCASESTERKEEFFRTLQFIYFWLYGFAAICFWNLYNVFIAGVWLRDTKWLLSDRAVLLIVINLLLDGLNGAVFRFREANGLYWQVKWRYLFSAIFNIVVSYILMGPCGMGVEGVLLGTMASILIKVSVDPILVCRHVFHKSAGSYYLRYLGYLALVAATGAAVYALSIPFSSYTVLSCIVRLLFCLIVPNALWIVIFHKNPHFLFLRERVSGLMSSVLGRLRGK